jgi:hypothetical protein
MKGTADSSAAAKPADDDDGTPTNVDFAAPAEATDDGAKDGTQVD